MTDQVVVGLLGLIGTISTAISAVLIAVVTRQRKESRETSRVIRRVRDQVENSHGTNLRDDLDVMRDGIHELKDMFSSLTQDVRGVRADLGRVDRRNIEDNVERRDLAKKLDDHLEWSCRQRDRIDDLERTMPNPNKPARS